MRNTWFTAIITCIAALAIAACAAPAPFTWAPQPAQDGPAAQPPADESALHAPDDVAMPPAGTITGFVRDADGPLRDATVRIQNTENATLSAHDGYFALKGITATKPLTVTAWSLGYYGNAVNAAAGSDPITITLTAYHTTDNVDYEFATAESCGECHAAYAEWQDDAHALAAVNHRFLTMYTGMDVEGNKATVKRDAANLPLPPEPGEPYYGPGLRLDFPDRTGNCAACHTPSVSALETTNTCGWSGCHTNFTASMSEQVPFGINPVGLTGSAAEGITCDFCHKIGNVLLDEQGLPFAARPGISSMQLFRPEEGHDLFLGTFDDVPGHDSYLPLQEESAFCAPCHYGVFSGVAGSHDVAGGVVIYNSYGEWLDSPYSDPETGQTCQQCHMPTVDYEYYVFPDKGGLARDPDRIHNHRMPGASDEVLLQNSVTMTTTAQQEAGEVVVEVAIVNDQTGHHVPTGTPLRHLILVVTATDSAGNALPLQDGPQLPDWTGDYAGQPGRTFAKVLRDTWSGEVPTGAYWRTVELVEDTRLAAFQTDSSRYAFAAPEEAPVTVEARLLYRRAFQDLAEVKGWDDPDILMEEATIELAGSG